MIINSMKFDIAALTFAFMVSTVSAIQVTINAHYSSNDCNANLKDPKDSILSILMTNRNRCLTAYNGGCYTMGPKTALFTLMSLNITNDPNGDTKCYGFDSPDCNNLSGTNANVTAFPNTCTHMALADNGAPVNVIAFMCFQGTCSY
jgi:hypothetical protein